MSCCRAAGVIAGLLLVALTTPERSSARNPIRRTFFDTYPGAEGTQLDDLPSNAGHCGVCHFDFDGGGPRNPYGLGIEVGLSGGLTKEEAIAAIENEDSDGDGFSNLVEITDLAHFGNTPTFPGLYAGNLGSISNVTVSEVQPYLTPTGGTDTTPPVVVVTSPTGGEVLDATSYYPISFTATDSSGIASINVYLSDDGGTTFKPVARNEAPGTGYSWFVPHRPGVDNRIRVEAVDNAGNAGHGESVGDFTIVGLPPGVVPTTLRDVDLSGTQPFEGAILTNPDTQCAPCHGNYDPAVEPWHNWRGGMMSQAARDPFFFACMAIAEQDAPGVGDLCIRCHSPGGWQEGRSVDTSGGLLNATDRQGVQCGFCHRAVDFDYVSGVSPVEDLEVLATVSPLPLQYGNGQFINDPAPLRRGPYADAEASHAFVESPFHRSSDICGTCHDVSNPVFVRTGPGKYEPTPFDAAHPDMDVRNMFPVERTFSEWSQSEYATTGVFAPQFAGDKADGIVSSCQDCHMRDVTGKGCSEPGAPTRSDLGLHDLTGGNTFVPDILPLFFPGEVDAAQLSDGKSRATAMLQMAATLAVTPEDFGVSVRVTNETAHKLPSGYPEGRRAWLRVEAVDATGSTVFVSGDYDFDTAELAHDEHLKIYEIHPGLSPGLATALGQPAGPSFHFVLSDTVYFDNRIPPRGFTNAGFELVQSPPVAYSYADGQYWDGTQYFFPATAETAKVALYYQTTSKEYVEFLRDANATNSAGQQLYDAWASTGKAPPVRIAEQIVALGPLGTDVGGAAPGGALDYGLAAPRPNPFRTRTTVAYSIPVEQRVRLSVFDVTGRRVRRIVDELQKPDRYEVSWEGTGDDGRALAPGIYFLKLETSERTLSRKVAHVK